MMIQRRGLFIYTVWAVIDYEQLALSAMFSVTSMVSIYYFVGLLVTCGFAVDPIVDLGYSKYEGTVLGNGVSQWLGIRFAAPPLGTLRFRAPSDPLQNATLQEAVEHGSICFGTGTSFPVAGASEDCLFLDVYAPTSATSDSSLPVYFFIQGGGFNDDSNPNYNGSGIVIASEMNIIVVNFNYRVGPYGFLASKEVVEDGDTNVGLLDQRKALEWVQTHISKFGGNPAHVVLGGDSAGAISITLHLTAFGGIPTNLFQATIAESQGFPMMLNVSQAQYQYDALIERVGCQDEEDTLSCLRSTDIATLQTANINIPYAGHSIPPLYMYAPIIDGDLIPDYTHRMFEQGRFVRVPMVFGDDTNEGTVFTPTNISTQQDMSQFLGDQFPFLTDTMTQKIDALYPKAGQFPNHGAYYSAAANAYGELRYICAGRFISTMVNAFGLENSWNYHYNVSDPTQLAEGLGVPHTIELNAIWGPNNTNGGAPASYFSTNAPIIPVMQGYWTSFIRTLNPNTHRAPGTPEWEPFGGNEQRILFMTNATRMENIPEDQKQRCDYLTSIGLELRQ